MFRLFSISPPTPLIHSQWFIEHFDDDGYKIRNAGSDYWAAACGDQVVSIAFIRLFIRDQGTENFAPS